MKSDKVLEVKNLKTFFFTMRGVVKAVDGVSFDLFGGQTLGLVGESGSGKTISCFSILKLVPKPAGRTVGGEVWFEGRDLLRLSEKQMKQIRGSQISMILQDPMTSLNPLHTIGDQVAEPLKIHQRLNKLGIYERVITMLKRLGITSPEVRVKEYPHQMSGGMRQRIVAAMVLACEPKILIADEPTTSLDVTIQAQYLRLLKELQSKSHISMIIVTHDFGIVARICDRVAVMYAGKIVEHADTLELFENPRHPYTRALMKSLPQPEKRVDRLFTIEGQPPDLLNLPGGCSFSPRCPRVMDICRQEYPPQSEVVPGHTLNCWLDMKSE
ncbi:MAG: ABC transporter ATP-binding protein [Desulfarculaceae bacterium]|jgi:oligopeptide/dipeptide ABC transporter ATP-binding protein